MNRVTFTAIALITLSLGACVKDRIPPATPPVITPTNDTLMYYWSFFNQDSSDHKPDFGVTSGAAFSYNASYVDYFAGGTTINSYNIADTGYALRVRNPSEYVIFAMPTTGYDSVVMAFAEQASSSGASINDISYTTDGTTYISTALSNNSISIGATYALYQFDFSSDPNTNNNPKFAVKITMANNNTGTSGNDRITNVSLIGQRK